MKETFHEQFTQLCEDMVNSPEIFFTDDSKKDREMNPGQCCRNNAGKIAVIDKYQETISFYYDVFRVFVFINDSLHISLSSRVFDVGIDYAFDNENHGFAKELFIHHYGSGKFGEIPINSTTETQLNLEGSASALFTPITPELTHANTEITYPAHTTPTQEAPITTQVFKELPIREVTIQMLHDWMQRTFPTILKPVQLDSVAEKQRLRKKIAPLFNRLIPTDDTLDFIASRESQGWELISVIRIDQAFRHTPTKNIFHYQASAISDETMVGVNLYFVKI
jgi:hypothetical protein